MSKRGLFGPLILADALLCALSWTASRIAVGSAADRKRLARNAMAKIEPENEIATAILPPDQKVKVGLWSYKTVSLFYHANADIAGSLPSLFTFRHCLVSRA